jgi:hypothetical protein
VKALYRLQPLPGVLEQLLIQVHSPQDSSHSYQPKRLLNKAVAAREPDFRFKKSLMN